MTTLKTQILRLLSGAVEKGGKAMAMSVMQKKIAGPKHKKSQTTGVIISVVDILGQNRMDTMRKEYYLSLDQQIGLAFVITELNHEMKRHSIIILAIPHIHYNMTSVTLLLFSGFTK